MAGLKHYGSLVLRALFVTFVARLTAEFIPPLHDLDAYLGDHPAVEPALIGLTSGPTLLGILLLAGTSLIVNQRDGRSAIRSERRVRSCARYRSSETGIDSRSRFYRFRGRTASVGFSDQTSIGELKGAWRRGAWHSNPRWLRFFLMMLGAMCVMFGLFGLFIVVGPAWIKLICIAACPPCQ